MVKRFILIPLMMMWLCASAQDASKEQVSWIVEYVSIDSLHGELIMKATMDDGMHIFAIDHTADFGLPTFFEVSSDSSYYYTNGPVLQPDPIIKEGNFSAPLRYYSHQATFKQAIVTIGKVPFIIKGNINYQACNDEMCFLPKDVPIKVIVRN
ncbi:MAG: hypothetical protein IPO27_12795 [Bacteroidetes bacterium]|nr:hypothetical protein [Bacteroidota bacterium]